MNLTRSTRRDFSVRLAAMLPVVGMAESALGQPDLQADRNGISHTAESIHQEVVFKGARQRIYESRLHRVLPAASQVETTALVPA